METKITLKIYEVNTKVIMPDKADASRKNKNTTRIHRYCWKERKKEEKNIPILIALHENSNLNAHHSIVESYMKNMRNNRRNNEILLF